MAYKRILAILLGMIMTIEAFPAVVFAKEIEPASGSVIVAEEEQAEETEATKAPVSETTAKKEKETPKAEEKKPSVTETEKKAEEKAPSETKPEEPSNTEAKKEAEPTEKETAEKEPAETSEETETGDKQPAPSESEKTTDSDEKAPAETETNETEAGEKEPEATDSKAAVNSNDQDEADLKDGETISESGRQLVETHVPAKKPDNDEQLESYFKKKTEEALGKSRPVLRKAAPSSGSRLSGNDKVAYDYLKLKFSEIAAGNSYTTVFEIPIADFGLGLENMTWSAEDLGVSTVVNTDSNGNATSLNSEATAALRKKVALPINLSSVDDALLADCPFELYWFDKIQGVQMYSYAINAVEINKVWKLYIVSGPAFCFSVSDDYSGGQYSKYGIEGPYLTSSEKIGRVNTAVAKAANVVKAVASEPDYKKLEYYCRQIMNFVEYDHKAVDDPDVHYGDPWQLISVFDGNSKTNVVCEGYSKAFMYLCNLTNFDGDISCITATGYIPEGGHMWNIVNMDDGKNYLVDVTNIDGRDTATEYYFARLFLTGYTSKFTNGYYYSGYKYTYDSDCYNSYSSDQLEINNKNYYIERSVSVSANDNKGNPQAIPPSAKPADRVGIAPNPMKGYELDHIEVYGTTIYGNYFYMRGVPANVEVFYKLKQLNVTVNASEGGSAKADRNSGHFGDVVTLEVTTKPGYALDKITVNNGDPLTGKTFTLGTEDAVVEVTFKKIPFSITVNPVDNGTASADLTEAGVGDTVTLNLLPDEGYFTKSVTVNGNPLTGNTFPMLPEPVTVEVEFAEIAQAAVGDVLTDGINNYRITNNSMNGTGTVSFIGSANQAASVSVPATVKLNGITYKVTRIASRAFYYNHSVTSVSIGANVNVIETNAFVGCSRLTKISGGSRLKTISSKAIVSCAKLKSFSISSTVLSKIGAYAFNGDKSLKTIYINKTTKLKKKGVKKSLKGSKVKTVKVKKSKVKKYKKYFTKKNCGRKVKVKK